MNTAASNRKSREKVYYDFQRIQQELFEESKQGKKNFVDLMELILSDNNILLAYRKIKSNAGSKTKGTDDWNIITLADKNQEEFIEVIRKTLANYKPQSIKRVMIDKNTGGKRPLGIPTIKDRLIQQMFLNVLEPICEGKFFNHSYGFRPIRTTRHAIARVQTLVNINKLHYTVDVDIKGFFDNVNHSLLMKQLWNIGIRDKRVLAIIGKILKSPIKGIGIPTKGVPQGGILSPLLSNVVLNDLDHWVADQWETFETKRKYSSNSYKMKILREKSSMKEGFIIRYADDFRIMARDHKTAYKWFHAVRLYLKDRLKLEISPNKSKVINLRKRSSEFLGYKFRAVKKSNKIVANTNVAEAKVKEIKNTLKDRVKLVQKQPTAKNVNLLNATILGMHNYFKYATHVNLDFVDIEYRLLKTMRNRLKEVAKYGYPNDAPPKGAYRKFYPISRKTYKIAGIHLFPIGAIKTTSNFNFSQNQNPFADAKHFSWDNEIVKLMQSRIIGRTVEYMDNRLSVYSMQKGVCTITNKQLTAEEVHCHHKTPISLGGTDKFNNLVIVHKDIHRLIHATKQESIRKYTKIFSLNDRQMIKLNQLRSLCKLEKIN